MMSKGVYFSELAVYCWRPSAKEEISLACGSATTEVRIMLSENKQGELHSIGGGGGLMRRRQLGWDLKDK